jgi:hypothetical protein
MTASDDAGSGEILRAADARILPCVWSHHRRTRNPAGSCGQVRSLGNPLIERWGMPERMAATARAAESGAANCIPAHRSGHPPIRAVAASPRRHKQLGEKTT